MKKIKQALGMGAAELVETGAGLGRVVPEPPPIRTLYVSYDDGSLGTIETDALEVDLGRPGHLIDQADYETALAALHEQRAAFVAELVASDEAVTLSDYTELRATGISDGAARRMSGYTGPVVEAGA